MRANISRGDKSASIYFPVGRARLAGVLSYLGIDHMNDFDLSCSGKNAMDIDVSLEPTGVAERTIAELCHNEGISLSRLNAAYEALDSLPYEKQLEIMDKVANQPPETFHDFRNILDSSAIPTVVTKFYCPLTVTLYARNRWDNIDGDGYEEDGRFAARYADRIREEMREFNAEDGENMAKYFYGNNSICAKLRSVVWDFAERGGELYGCITVETAGALTPEQEQELKDWISGQNSDGLGEGFEQREIILNNGYSSGEIYVSLWHSGDDYFIDNEYELAERLERQSMTMGGM